jgi:hypothetical protein
LVDLLDFMAVVMAIADKIIDPTRGQSWSDGVKMVHANMPPIYAKIGHFTVELDLIIKGSILSHTKQITIVIAENDMHGFLESLA